MADVEYTYRITLPDRSVKEFKISLDAESMRLLNPRKDPLPEWTRLEVNQCSNCPLKPSESPHCPVAAGAVDLIETFKDTVATTPVKVEVLGANRDFVKDTQISQAISAIMGIYMTTTGCPILDKMRPMVLTHIPFASITETRYRVLAMYLIAQLIILKKGKEPDWDLTGLVELSKEVSKVNLGFCARLHQVCSMDASLNAVISLDCFASSTQLALKSNALDEFEAVFAAYLEEVSSLGGSP